jgi:hypothetical protein
MKIGMLALFVFGVLFLGLGIYTSLYTTAENIRIDQSVTCNIIRNDDAFAKYIMENYGKEGDFNKVTYALWRHGYYLRNLGDYIFVFVSYADDGLCPWGNFSVDSSLVVARTDRNLKLLSLSGS